MRIAILVENGFEKSELVGPKEALDEAGAKTRIVSPQHEWVRSWDAGKWDDYFPVDIRLDSAHPEDFEALVLPGGMMNPDKLRTQPRAIEFVRAFLKAGKPIAAICHAAWTLIEAGAARGRRIASLPSLKTDLINAGAEWVDEGAVVSGNILSGRKPDDIPAFNKSMISLFAESQDGPNEDRHKVRDPFAFLLADTY